MRAGPPLALALFLLASPGSPAQADGPVEAAVKYHEAMQAHRCKEAWALSSKARQERIRGEEDSCGRIGKFKPGTAQLVVRVGNEAVVSAMFRGRPGRNYLDFGSHFSEYTEELDLVREGGAWKVEWPRTKIGSTHAILSVGIGPVDFRRDPVARGLHHKLEATVSSRTPREALERALRDPNAWATLLPSFKSIEPLERKGDRESARLSFADPSTPIPVTVRLAGSPVDSKADWTSVEWEADKGLEAPVYMRGSWTLKPNPNGTTHVNLTLVLNPRHWPDYEKMFWAGRMARSLTRLEELARKR